MNQVLRLMCVLAHPDDESMGTGSTLVRYAREGVETYLVTATRGERGWSGDEKEYPGSIALGKRRQAELVAAAQLLGLRQVYFLDYIDGELNQVDSQEAIQKITRLLRLVRPQVVITFGPDGNYGHPDHIAISQLTSAAIVSAADCKYVDPEQLPAHSVSKLYYMLDTRQLWEDIDKLIGEINIQVEGILRRPVLWEDWAVTTRIGGRDTWRIALKAVQCHQTQLNGMPDLNSLTDDENFRLWGDRTYYRVFSLVNGHRQKEDDLFSGLRG
jgi:LmbE family N-acetylglucosaminyl deacetylase